jgi:hypothetical protein
MAQMMHRITIKSGVVGPISLLFAALLASAGFRSAVATEQRAKPTVADEVAQRGYERVERMVPMRDGVKLYTVIYSPKDKSKTYPILLVRTAYGSDAWVMNSLSHSIGPTSAFDRDGYIFVYQDIRGLGESGGTYVPGDVYIPVKRSVRDVDQSSDAYDTIDWLVKNVPGNNHKVGIWGISAEGRTTIFALIHHHPALVAASPQAAPADFYVGDDAYHNGAFRPAYNFDFMLDNQRVAPGKGALIDSAPYRSDPWDYDFFLRSGSMENIDATYLHGAAPVWLDLIRHDTYDSFWRSRNVLKYLSGVSIPVLTVGGWFDAEDFHGTLANYDAIEAENSKTRSSLILGPWNHGGWYYLDGHRFGDIQFGQKTAVFYRNQVLRPFFRKYLKGQGTFNMPRVLAFNTGANAWRRFTHWPPQHAEQTSLYLGAGGRISFKAPVNSSDTSCDTYTSDPNRPVPFTTEIRKGMGGRWIIEDQRLASTRPDVLVYETPPLRSDLTIAGKISADLSVATSGTDSDWIVKLIDVYPDDAPNNASEAGKIGEYEQKTQMGGYEMLLSAEILRGKFRHSLSNPQAMTPGRVVPIHIELPDRLHTFLRGHRVMIQIQSSWFPLYDRNPQQFMKIADAKPGDFKVALESVCRSYRYPSRIRFDTLDPRALAAATYDSGGPATH